MRSSILARAYLTFYWSIRLEIFTMWVLTQKLNVPRVSFHFINPCNIKVHPHYATWQNTTHCNFTAQQKLHGICRQSDRVHIKRIFCEGYKNCGTRPVNFVWFFSLTSWCNFETPYSSYAAWQTFDETDILPMEFSWGTDMPRHKETLPKPHRINVYIILAICRAARPHFVPFCHVA